MMVKVSRRYSVYSENNVIYDEQGNILAICVSPLVARAFAEFKDEEDVKESLQMSFAFLEEEA